MSGATPVIRINMDHKCKRCGKLGTGENGYCMECAVLVMRRLDLIGDNTLRLIVCQVKELFETYQQKINLAAKNNGNKVSVAFTADLSVMGGNQVAVQTGIGFVAEKIRDRSEMETVSEIQGGLFDEEHREAGE